MHEYSTDRSSRRQVHFYLTIGTLLLGSFLIPKFNPSVTFFVDHTTWIKDWAWLWGGISVSAIYTVLYFVFNRYVWKVPYVSNALGIKDFSGVWSGYLKSSYDDHKKEIPLVLDIKQFSDTLYIKAYTATSQSHSISASITLDANGDGELRYQYMNNPSTTAVPSFDQHFGFSILRLGATDIIQGVYFTNSSRRTYGDIRLKRFLGNLELALQKSTTGKK